MGPQTEGQEQAIRLLALIQGHDVPSSRYRVLQWLPSWEEAGHESVVIEHAEALDDPTGTLERAGDADVVLFHRKRLPPAMIGRLARGRRAVYDIDDAVMFRDALKPGRARSWLRRRRYNRMVRAMDQVIVGNRYIASHTPVDSVEVLPTCIDTTRYDGDHGEPDRPTLVWIGDTGSLHYLESRRELLAEIGRRVPGARLKIICSRFFDVDGLETVKIPWSARTEVAELADSHVGLMPLGTDPWSRGKCALKFLQYLAVGRPAVVTPVGMNADILGESACGLKADDDRGWIDACVRLLTDHELRRKMGRDGHHLVRERYSVSGRASDWVRLVSGTP